MAVTATMLITIIAISVERGNYLTIKLTILKMLVALKNRITKTLVIKLINVFYKIKREKQNTN